MTLGDERVFVGIYKVKLPALRHQLTLLYHTITNHAVFQASEDLTRRSNEKDYFYKDQSTVASQRLKHHKLSL